MKDQFKVILISIVVFLGIVMLCIEPTDFSEYSLYEYEHYFDKHHVGWYMLRVWYSLIGLLIVTVICDKIKLGRA